MTIQIRQSTLADLPVLMQLFESGKRIMRRSGNLRQWTGSYPSENVVAGDIHRGHSYLCLDETGRAVGTFAFIPGDDPTYARIYKGEWLDNTHPYATIHRRWKAGDVVEVDLPMDVRRVKANELAEDDRGKLAIERGPIMFCLEGKDQPDSLVFNKFIPDGTPMNASYDADLLNGVVQDDAILVASNSVDVHGRLSDNSTEYITVKNGRWYGLPYRSLVPLEVDNLLVAGRSISATSDAAGAVRVMPPCMAMGQAAGIAAAIAVNGGTAPRNVDASELRKLLLKNKAFLG